MGIVESRHDELAAEINHLCPRSLMGENLFSADCENFAIGHGDGLRSRAIAGRKGVSWCGEMSACVNISVCKDDVGRLCEPSGRDEQEQQENFHG